MSDAKEIAIADLREENESLCEEISKLKKNIKSKDKKPMPESDKYDLKLIRHIHKYVQVEIHEYYQKEPSPLRIAMQVDDLENIEDALRRAINIIEHKEVTNELNN